MTSTSLQPRRGLGRGFFSRQKQVREAIGEARAALQESLGVVTPTPRRGFPLLREWVLCCTAGLVGRVRRLGAVRPSPDPARHTSTLAVLLLLGLVVIVQSLGVSIAYSVAATQGAEGGMPIIIQGSEPSLHTQAFAFAIAPITVAGRRPTADEPPPEDTQPITESANLFARREVTTYTVQAGDTLDQVAARFDVAAYTLYWLNELPWPGKLQEGRVLTIPPISGVPHTVEEGETLYSIADLYGVLPGNIVAYPPNGLKHPYHLEVGQKIFVPGAIVEIPNYRTTVRPPPTIVKMPGGEKLSWPSSGRITAPFGWSRGYDGYHKGLDIADGWGTPIYAAAAGRVVEAGWGGLGWYVVIDHENGFQTEYGHMAQRPLVSAGDRVARGDPIGRMGQTYGAGGRATGVHLHFAVRHHGVLIDPLPLLGP